MPDSLATVLDMYSVSALDSIARKHGLLPSSGKNKARIIQVLVRALTDKERVTASYRGLPMAGKAIINAILRRDAPVSVRGLRVELSRMGLIDPKADVGYTQYSANRINPNATSSRRLEDLLAHLTLLGLVFSSEPSGPYQSNKLELYSPLGSVFIPKEIRSHLPTPPALPERKLPAVKPAMGSESSARVFQRDLYLYWSYLNGLSHPPYLTARGELAKKSLREVNALLLDRYEIQTGEGENDYPRLRFLRGMLTDLGLVQDSVSGGLATTGRTDFFALPAAQRVKTVYNAWLSGAGFNELIMLHPEVRPRSGTQHILPAPKPVLQARQVVAEQVRKLKPSGWVSLDALVEDLKEYDYEFLLPRRTGGGPYYFGATNPYDGASSPLGLTFPGIYREDQGWDLVEANFIRLNLIGPLYWMGLVDVGWEKAVKEPAQEVPNAFRLTPLGLWVMGLGPLPNIPEEGGRVVVQPTLQIIALDPIQDSVLVTLDRFAERLSAERAVEYRLTRASVYAAQKAGWDAERIKAFLVEHTGEELPVNVSRTLDEWQALYERIIIHPAVVLAHGLPETLDRLESGTRTARYMTSRPLPEVALLEGKKSIGPVVSALHAEGILPLVSSQGSLPPRSVQASDDGQISLRVNFPSLYLHGHLAAFARPTGDGPNGASPERGGPERGGPYGFGYQISRESVGMAVQAGMDAPQIISRLEAVHDGPLPQGLVKRIRAWAQHFGPAALEEVTLLQVRDEKTLAELLEDPEIAPLLRAFKPSPAKALARVRIHDLARLRRLLEERGIDLHDKLDS